MSEVLTHHGYVNEDGLWYWPGKCDETASGSEKVLLQLLASEGPVVHHSQLCEAFLVSHYSLPALYAAINNSPLFVKVATGLYSLRGTRIGYGDLERAERAAVRVAPNVEVAYSAQGKLLLRFNVSVISSMTGVLFSGQLPNLEGIWPCSAEGAACGDITLTQNEIRHLSTALAALDCPVGGRVELAFDMWDRYVEIRRIDEA
jgi:hypothetical protein